MLPEYAEDVLRSFIPAVDPKAVRRLVEEWQEQGKVTADLFAVQLPANICQGDVLGPLPFVWRDSDGALYEDEVNGMLISQSCDYDNDSVVIFAPCDPFDRYAKLGFKASVEANEKTSLFYLPAVGKRPALVADLAQMQPISKAAVAVGLAEERIKRVCGFTDLGYALFVMKLTVHFMRPQPVDEIRGSGVAPLSDRLRSAAHQGRALMRYVIARRRTE